MNIKILGTGCPNCIKLANMFNEAVKELGVEAQIEKVTDTNSFPDYGVWLTPGIIINGQVKLQGKMPTLATIKGWIKTEESKT
jgi:small redox-active disulfide protein 2